LFVNVGGFGGGAAEILSVSISLKINSEQNKHHEKYLNANHDAEPD
jgi:hypothetical protein